MKLSYVLFLIVHLYIMTGILATDIFAKFLCLFLSMVSFIFYMLQANKELEREMLEISLESIDKLRKVRRRK